jgi:hypothetical protein
MSIPSSFGVSATTGVLASWLGASTTAASAANILGATGSTTGGGPLTALLTKSTSTAPSTAQALAGLIKPSQQRVIGAIGDNNGPLSIPWNANGSEPTTLAALRTAGWLKLDAKVLTNGKPSGGTYELTKIGTAIYNRTGGGQVGADNTPLTSADTNGTTADSSGAAAAAAAEAQAQSGVANLAGLLGSLGISA